MREHRPALESIRVDGDRSGLSPTPTSSPYFQKDNSSHLLKGIEKQKLTTESAEHAE